jgi:hypothetical protein
MSHWNHRVVLFDDHGEPFYEIHEVYYNDNNEIAGMTKYAVGVSGETVEDIKQTLERMMSACNKEVIIESEIVYGKWSEDDDGDDDFNE